MNLRERLEQTYTGPSAWMIRNRVSPNLLMLALLIGGLYMTTRIRQEVFPEISQDTVTISMAYPGASPEEVEQGILLSIEEGVRGLEGVKEVSSTAAQGSGKVVVELLENADGQTLYQDIQQEVNRIRTFPKDAEEPVITLDVERREVLKLAVHGKVPEFELRNLADEVRDRLLQSPGITQVEIENVPDFEVHIEVPEQALRAHGLTLEGVAERIGASAVEIPGGGVKTAGGEILVRFKDRRDWAREFAAIPLVTTPAGAVLTVGDIAEVREGFEDTEKETSYNGESAVGMSVRRSGDETPIGISEAAFAALEEIRPTLPPGVEVTITDDRSDTYRQRLDLLLRNAAMGLGLVLLLLGLFLEIKLALWVTLGIPVSFLGGLLIMPMIGVTINMVSMFAFIIALGIVVDDAIIVGENIYEYRQRGLSHLEAALRGTRDVAVPVAFSILTNVVAFLPLLFIPGRMGQIWLVVPMVVITVFLVSWMESVLILPSHLAHTSDKPASRITARLHDGQQAFARLLQHFIRRVYAPFVDLALRWRFLTVAAFAVLLMLVIAYVASGRIGRILMPRVEADKSVATVRIPFGSPIEKARAVRDRLIATAREVAAEFPEGQLLVGVESKITENVIEIEALLNRPEIRPLSTIEMTRRWRERTGQIAGVESLQYAVDRGGPGSGAALTIELSHRDIDVLDRASNSLAAQLADFPNVKDINNGYTPGKPQLDFRLTEYGRSLGLTSAAVARQVRAAFYGSEALRQQRGRNELTVLVRLPESQRVHENDIERMLIRTPAGRDVPLLEVASVERGRAYTTITRREGRRTVSVTADVDPIGQTTRVQEELNRSILPRLAADFPGLSLGYEGRQADMKESTDALMYGLLMVLLAIYFLLAVPFRSYTQPAIVMISIPFGLVGAILGHMAMGYDLSVMSMMGMIALSGVVVNDSLVLIEYANRQRTEAGMSAHDAICAATVRRFRPILLTTLTTFGGLAPMIFETSRQARFLIPMALSLGYGILFGTLIALVLVPCLYLLNEDIARFVRMFRVNEEEDEAKPPTPAGPDHKTADLI